MSQQAMQQVLIMGGGSSGWMTAAVLAKHLQGTGISVTLVESAQIGTIGVGESTVPPFVQLLHHLNIPLADFMKQTQSTFKLGIDFVNWQGPEHSYFHPFGAVGINLNHHEFFQCWLRQQQAQPGPAYEAYSPCWHMAQQQRFFLPSDAPDTPIASADFALHVDASRVAGYFKDYACRLGVCALTGDVCEVNTHASGALASLQLQDGRVLTADFFIDCSGFASRLLGQACDSQFEHWNQWLPCDRAWAMATAAPSDLPNYTQAIAEQAGWRWRIPLQQRLGQGHVFASGFVDEEQALDTLLSAAAQRGEELLNAPRLLRFQTGMRKQLWRHNCVGIGLAGGFIEPLESTALHLVVRGALFLLRYFPHSSHNTADRALTDMAILAQEYNRAMTRDYEEIRDFIILHYCLSRRDDSDFWRYCGAMPLPDSLSEKLALYRLRGIRRHTGDDLFGDSSWHAVCAGMGELPVACDPLVHSLAGEQVEQALERYHQQLSQAVPRLPSHSEFLQRFCWHAD